MSSTFTTINIGSTPPDEPCVPVDNRVSGAYLTPMQTECRHYREALRRGHGSEPKGAKLVISRHEHDFGPYYDVECAIDEQGLEAAELEAAHEYALACEGCGVEKWADVGMTAPITNTHAEGQPFSFAEASKPSSAPAVPAKPEDWGRWWKGLRFISTFDKDAYVRALEAKRSDPTAGLVYDQGTAIVYKWKDATPSDAADRFLIQENLGPRVRVVEIEVCKDMEIKPTRICLKSDLVPA